MSSQKLPGGPAPGDTAPADQGRRDALAKMGGLAAPAFVALLTTDASVAWSASGRPGKPTPKPTPKPKPIPKPKLPKLPKLPIGRK